MAGDANKSDIVEVAVANFDTRGYATQGFTTNATTLKNTINGLTTSRGTNWEEGLQYAKTYADSIKSAQPDEDVYIIFLTDGEPTTHDNSYNVNVNYATEWGYAKDDARSIVEAGYKFYALFTWGSNNSSHYLSSLVQYAYTGTGNSNSSLSADYAQYYTDASDTATLISALTQIVNDITTGVGYTNVALEDGVTAMTASSVKATASGDVTGLKYYRSGKSYSTTANNGLGEEWAEAPAATINAEGEVDWNLGNLVLEDGVTYTVAFTVWPKQESVDLVAELNNGIKDYDSLMEAEKAQIIKNGNAYTLKTNTDFPTLTYSTVTTTTVNGKTQTVVSSPKTVELDNPEPVDLYSKKIAMQKLWEDSLDPTQREEEVEDIYLQFYMDGREYEELTGYDKAAGGIKVTNQSGSVWAAGEIAIAPGLMVSEGHAAYDETAEYGVVTLDGKKYAILNPGHDYEFGEKDINGHFELTKYQYHPMLVDGELKNVTFIYDGDTITGVEAAEGMTTISATNTIKGGINIQKVVTGKTDVSEDAFTVKAYLKNPDGSDYSYDYRIYYGENNPCYTTQCTGQSDSDFARRRSGHIYGDGTIEAEIYVGDVIRVVNVADGTLYYVEEDEAAMPKGYELDSIDYTITYGTDAAQDDVAADGYYAVKGNSASTATITNVYNYGDLEVSKVVQNTNGDANAIDGKEFEFAFNLYTDDNKSEEIDKTYSYTGSTEGTIASGETVKLKDGETIKIAELPVGAYYEISETEESGFTTDSTGETGTIAKNKTSTAEFTNTYAVAAQDVTIRAYKGFDDFWLTGDEFTFEISGSQGAPMPAQTTATVNSALTPAEWTVRIEGYTAEGYVYTITEPNPAIRGGVSRVENDEDIVVTVTTTDNGDGTLSVTKLYNKGDATVTEEDKDVLINNTYVAEPVTVNDPEDDASTKLLLTKETPGYAEEAEKYDFSFELRDEAGEVVATATAHGAEALVMLDGVLTFTEAGTYTYTLTEVAGQAGGFTYDTAEHTITIAVTDDGNGKLKAEVSGNNPTFTNTYTATGTYGAEGELEFTKIVLNQDEWEEIYEFGFQLYEIVESEDGEELALISESTATKDKQTFSFAALEFDLTMLGEHTYVILETPFDIENVSQVTEYILFTLTVSDNYDGTLNIEASDYDNVFYNNYDEPGRGELEPTVTPNTGRFTKAEDGAEEQNLFGTIAAMVALGAAAYLVIASKRKV